MPKAANRVRVAQRAIRMHKALRDAATGQVYVKRTGTDTYEWIKPSGDIYEVFEMTNVVGNVLQLRGHYMGHVLVAVDDLDPSVVRSGSGWTTTNPQPASYGGSYSRTTSAGGAVTYTTPAGTTKVGILYVAATNAGVSKVEIDGSLTAANLCLTANEMVTLGYITAAQRDSIGGGTRVVTLYSPNTVWSVPRMLATNLAPGVHTVKLTALGFKDQRTLSPDTDNVRLYVTGMAYATASTTLTDLNALTLSELRFNGVGSAFEFAYSYRPTGQSSTFIGNVHGQESQLGAVFSVDGAPASPAVGEILTGDLVRMVRTSELFHPDTGATKQADATVTYELALQGLRVKHREAWTGTGEVATGYPAMMPFDGSFNRVIFDNVRHPLTMSGPRTTDTPYGSHKCSAVFLYNGQYVAGFRFVNAAVAMNNWQRSFSTGAANRGNVFALYRADGLNKVYATRVYAGGSTPADPISPGVVWESDVIYVAAKVSDPLARLLAA